MLELACACVCMAACNYVCEMHVPLQGPQSLAHCVGPLYDVDPIKDHLDAFRTEGLNDFVTTKSVATVEAVQISELMIYSHNYNCNTIKAQRNL
jgi:hypothetical protein